MVKDLSYFMKLDYRIYVEHIDKPDNSYYTAEIEELPGCSAVGETIEKALEAINTVKELYFEHLLEQRYQVPEPGDMSYRNWVQNNRPKERTRIPLKGKQTIFDDDGI